MEVGDKLERVCADLNAAIEQARSEGYRLDVIYPADDPHEAILSGPGGTLRLTTNPGAPRPSDHLPPFQPEYVLTRASGDGGAGRAGMLYRDLIPSRLGGRYIASHIRVPGGGPVADWVHYHRIGFQMIAVRSGWVRVVYEGQGEPFVMRVGDVVLQPPGIRHRVLDSGDDLEVVEIGAPALHETFADHELVLPTGLYEPLRDFGGQQFLRHIAAETPWTALGGGEAQQTAMRAATGGLADVRILRGNVDLPGHGGELVFGFVLSGSALLKHGDLTPIGPADAFVIPPNEAWSIAEALGDFRLLQVTTAKLATFA
ncbi:hypothetical protein [Sphingomonas sp.]|uniref:hypothetical protein n=1 Tax=Sphingomonas sp. TaxID=28214 RepID=UPI00286B89B7|nr:hypothetical protein [Sphingomonas sp.]